MLLLFGALETHGVDTMIRADSSNRVQASVDLALRPAPPAHEITDKLPGLVTGQRLLAEIQSLTSNGTYRALINQRNVTLALPFAAKNGDTIELEVVESDGKLTLAVVSNADNQTSREEASATTLSRTGQIIAGLMAALREAKSGLSALSLNGNQPIADSPPGSGRDLLPLLEQAISRSGMFYEAHQAGWLEGRYSKAQLLQEPQGMLTPRGPPQTAARGEPGGTGPLGDRIELASTASQNWVRNADSSATPSVAIDAGQRSAPETSTLTEAVAQQAQVLVQQQLEALATQSFSWQGQIWPGQQIEWEIDGDPDRHASTSDEEGNAYRTRLRLTLPRLGDVDARLSIQGPQISLTVIARSPDTCTLLRSAAVDLRDQMENAGLDLTSLGITVPPE